MCHFQMEKLGYILLLINILYCLKVNSKQETSCQYSDRFYKGQNENEEVTAELQLIRGTFGQLKVEAFQ